MSAKSDILQIIFGGILLGAFVQFGILSPDHGFTLNVLPGIAIYVFTRVLAWIFG